MKAVRMKPCVDVVLDIPYKLDVMSLAYVSWFIDFVKIYVKLRRTFYVLTLTKTITAYFQNKYRNYILQVYKFISLLSGLQHMVNNKRILYKQSEHVMQWW